MVYPLPKNLNILLIEGQDSLASLRSTLQALGMRVTLVDDAERAYGRANALRPDIILMSLPLSNGSGTQLLQLLKANTQTASIPVLALSSSATPESRLDAFKLGVRDFFQYPASVEEIVARIVIHLGLTAQLALPAIKTFTESSEEELSQDNDAGLVNAAQRYIKDHLSEIPNTRTIAKKLNVTDRQLVDAFKQYLNMTPFEYVRKERMRRAEILLRTTSMRLEKLAEEIGYSSAANFVTAFKDYKGIPPAQYRREKIFKSARKRSGKRAQEA